MSEASPNLPCMLPVCVFPLSLPTSLQSPFPKTAGGIPPIAQTPDLHVDSKNCVSASQILTFYKRGNVFCPVHFTVPSSAYWRGKK